MQNLPTPADGSLQSRSSQHKDGWFNQAFADSVTTTDTWDASYTTKATGSLPEIGAAYGAQLTQAGSGQDAACLATHSDAPGQDGFRWFSDCWVKSGFSLSLSYIDGRQEHGVVLIDASMTENPAASPTT